MRKVIYILLALLFTHNLFAQAPLGFNYQGIAREADGTPISGKEIAIRVSIIDGPQGSSEFEEVHFLTTNDFGLFTAVIGQGNGNGTLNQVNWAGGNLWLQIELDPDDSGNFILMGSQQLMSVPYALFAQQSGAGLSPGYGVDINNGTISNVLPDRPITLTGKGNVQVSGTYPNFTIESNGSADGDADASNEIQNLSKVGNEVSLSKGGGSFTDAVDDADADATNELIESATLVGTSLEIKDAGGTQTVDLATLQDGTGTDAQELTLTGNTLSLTNSTPVDLSGYLDDTDTQLTEAEVDVFVGNNGYLTSEVDGSLTNEIQDLQLVGNELTITRNGTATTIDLSPYLDNTDTQLTEAEVDAFANNNGHLTSEVDGSITNEIQDLQLLGNDLEITNNGSATTIDLSGYLDNTDDQTLSVSTPAINPVLRQIDISGASNSSISFSVADSDDDTSNEIQSLTLNINSLDLTSGGSVDLLKYLDNTDEQNLSNVLGVSNSAGSNNITNLLDPTLEQDAATKKYVDASDGVLQASINTNATGISNNATSVTANTTAISSETTSRGNGDTALQNELDAAQTGAGLNADGAYSADPTTNYINGATSLKNADKLLDTQVQSNSSDITTLTNRLDNTYSFQADFTINEVGAVAQKQVVLTENLGAFNQISSDEIIVGATGLYLILVDAERTNVDNAITNITIRVNLTDHIIYVSNTAQNIARSLMLNLSTGDSVLLLVTTKVPQAIPLIGVIGGYKISD